MRPARRGRLGGDIKTDFASSIAAETSLLPSCSFTSASASESMFDNHRDAAHAAIDLALAPDDTELVPAFSLTKHLPWRTPALTLTLPRTTPLL
jgi:hypothetical protein